MSGARGEVSFGAFRLDLQRRELWRDTVQVRLRKKTSHVLCCLIEGAGEVVSAEDLFACVWPGTAVTPRVLTNVIGELRRALGEERGRSRIVNEHGRGYRFVLDDDSDGQNEVGSSGGLPLFVGRELELERLASIAAAALDGNRQVVFIAGEAGIGKSTLLAVFEERVRASMPFLVARSGTAQRESEVEPFAPILDLLEQIADQAPEVELGELLLREAPTWLLQLPWLAAPADVQRVGASLRGVGTGRMLREGARLLERLAAQRPLVVVLEDLHWFDSATLDLLATVERRDAAAPLLVVGTYRPVQVMSERHALGSIVSDLRRRGRLQEIDLAGLTRSSIERYLTRRYPRIRLPPSLVPSLETQTRGNPLFLRAMADHLTECGYLEERADGWVAVDVDLRALDLPGGVREAVHAELARLTEVTRSVVCAGAVSGLEPTVAEIAAATGLAATEVERECHRLGEVGYFLRPGAPVTWPDGERTFTYRFTHPLVRQACLAQVPILLRRSLHQRVGERLEGAFANNPVEVVGALVEHFEAANDTERTASYLELAASTAYSRFAYREAATYLERALALIQTLPESAERRRREAQRQLDFTNMGSLASNRADPRVRAAVDRAYELAMMDGDGFTAFRAQMGRLLTSMASFKPDCMDLAEPMVGMTANHPTLAAVAHLCTSYALGQAGKFDAATKHAEQSLVAEAEPGIPVLFDVRRAAFTQLGTLLTMRGFLDQGVEYVERALARADVIQRPPDGALALALGAMVYAMQGGSELARATAERGIALSLENDLRFYLSEARATRAWAVLQDGNPRGLRDMIANMHAGAAHGTYSHNTQLALWIAEAICQRGDLGAAEPYLDIARRGEAMFAPEVKRVEAELHFAAEKRAGSTRGRAASEDACREAITLAQQAGAKLFELRAAMSLVTGTRGRPSQHEARTLLADAYDWFQEGLDTPYLQAAARLLNG